MSEVYAVVLGICIGAIGALIPIGVLYRGKGFIATTPQGLMVEGLAAIVLSFAFMSLGIYVAVMYEALRVLTPISVVITFLFVWSFMAWRLHKSRGRMHRGRKGN